MRSSEQPFRFLHEPSQSDLTRRRPGLRFLSLSVASFFLSERNFSLDLLGPDASELFDLVLDRLDILDLDRLSDLVLDLLVLDLVLLEVLDLDLLRFSPERS